MRTRKLKKASVLAIATAAGLVAWIAFDRPVPGSTACYRSLSERYLDCGMQADNSSTYKPPSRDMQRCLMNAFAQCRPAKLHSTGFTMEGDPVSSTTVIEEGRDGSCQVHIYADNRADRFASVGLGGVVCTKMKISEEHGPIFSDCEDEHVRGL